MASKWLKNKPKMQNFPGTRPKPLASRAKKLASRVFIFTGDTNFPYFDHWSDIKLCHRDN